MENSAQEMKKKNLCCLVDRDNEHIILDLIKLSEISQELEINLEKGMWLSKNRGWTKIGEISAGADQIRFVFDRTNFKHLEKAFEIAQDFQR